jgi:hypothetical protein
MRRRPAPQICTDSRSFRAGPAPTWGSTSARTKKDTNTRKIVRIPSINKIKKPKNPNRLNVEIENVDKINFIAKKFKQGILEMLTYFNQISS